MIWSEPPFIALLMIAIVVSLRKMTAAKVMSLIVLFIALFFVRYVGPVFAVAITAASIYFDRRQLGWLKSVAANVLALGISFIPVWWWLARNQDIDGTLTGARVPGGGTLLSPLKTFTSTIGSWIVAKPVEGGIYLSWDSYPQNTKAIGALFVVIFFVLGIVCLVTMLRRRQVSQDFNILFVSATVLFAYVAFSAYRFVHFELGPLDNRMMIPIYVPMVLIIAITIDKIEIKPKPLRLAFGGFFSALVALQAFSSINDSIKFGQDGRYWAARDFINQPLHKFIDSLPPNSLLMSNQPQQLFAVWQESSVLNQYQLDAAQATPCENRYFVWYNSTYDDGTPNLEGQPEGAEVLFSDPIGSILDLGKCDGNIATYWP
jgi:general stress protein CsbA